MSIYSVDGTSLLNRFQSIDYTFTNSEVDTANPLADYGRKQTVFQEVSTSASFQEDVAGSPGVRASGVDLVITADTVDLCPIFKSGSISINNTVNNEKGACSGYAYNVATDSDMVIDMELYTNTEDEEFWLAKSASTDYIDHIVAMSMNLGNGTTIAGNFKISEIGDSISAGSTNTRKLKLTAHDLGSGAYPTSPATDNSWLNGVIMNPRAAVAVSIAADNANHTQLDFNAVYESVEITIPQSGVLSANVSLKSQGVITVTPN